VINEKQKLKELSETVSIIHFAGNGKLFHFYLSKVLKKVNLLEPLSLLLETSFFCGMAALAHRKSISQGARSPAAVTAAL
jgi:hypothetical protein